MRSLIGAMILTASLMFPRPAVAADPAQGWASTWQGPGAATHDCVWPWTHCTPRRVTSLSTGISIIVTPQMYCYCIVPGTPHPVRLIDLSPDLVQALGLPGPGMYPVEVELVDGQGFTLPNTATR